MMPVVHARYIKIALGNLLSKDALNVMQTGAKNADTLHGLTITAQHTTNDPARGVEFIARVGEFVKESLIRASGLLEELGKSETAATRKAFDMAVIKALYGKGRMMHALHDTASHWGILNENPAASRGFSKMLTGEENIPGNVRACKGLKVPGGLGNLIIEEAREGIWSIRLKLFPQRGLSRSFAKRLDKIYADTSGPIQTHFLTSLDKPGTPRDLWFKLRHGFSGFKAASRASIANTRDMSAKIKRDLENTLGAERTDVLFGKLTRWRPDPELVRNAHRIGEEALLPHIREFIESPISHAVLRIGSNFIVDTFKSGQKLVNKAYNTFKFSKPRLAESSA